MKDVQKDQDDILFEQLKKKKRKKRRKILITILIILILLAAAVIIGVPFLQRKVQTQFVTESTIESYEASMGRISTTVSGTGMLTSVGSEQITVPNGVELDEILVRAGDTVDAGDPIASVKTASVMTALSDLQSELDDLDDQIDDAENDSVSSYFSSKVKGRVKIIYAEVDENVVDCMADHGALAVLSLDGCMAVDIDAGIAVSEKVTVITSDGKTYDGTVVSSTSESCTITLTDNGPLYDDEVTVTNADGTQLGTGKLYIHSPLSITGYAGTISRVSIQENQVVYQGSTMFTLKNTGYSANYDSLIEERSEKEETYNELLEILRSGNVCSPISGTVLSIDYTDSSSSSSTAASSMTLSASASTSSDSFNLATVAPDEKMEVELSIDETDILSLEVGQTAQVTVKSVSDEAVTGEVTEISKAGTSSSGVTSYSAVVTIDKQEKMLRGMTATVEIQIQSEGDALLVPIEAVHSTSTISYVYTTYDEETQTLGGVVTVETGVSNSKYIEITSGLSEGDTVYYDPANTNDFFAGFGDFGGGSDFGGFSGGMPSGGGDFGGFSGGGGMPGGDFGGQRGG